MNQKRLDVVIFGATGFTGKYVVKELANSGSIYKWGVAGRNIMKLKQLLESNGRDDIPIIVADCGDSDSLNEMAMNTKLLINCCGPYRFTGEAVVQACVRNKTHYLDISGEPEFMEKIQLTFDKEAEKNECYVVSSCGFDSIPADFGVVYILENFKGLVNTVQGYLKMSNTSNHYEPYCNYTTWESLVYGFKNINNLINIRKQLYDGVKRPKLKPPMKKENLAHELFDCKYIIPAATSDRSVVARSQMFRFTHEKQRPVQFDLNFVSDNLLTYTAMLYVGLMLKILIRFDFGISLLLKYPKIFSLGIMTWDGPSKEAAEKTTACFRFKTEGWSEDVVNKVVEQKDLEDIAPNQTMTSEIVIPNPAYKFTSKCVIQCAFTILEEQDRMPSVGGVYTPAAAFGKTTLLKRLMENGASFKILNSKI